MIVENYKEGYDDNWNWGYRRHDEELDENIYNRILIESKEYLSGFGIRWDQYDDGKLIFDNMLTCQAEFTHLRSGNQIHLSNIYFDEETWEILQAGTNYGCLTL